MSMTTQEIIDAAANEASLFKDRKETTWHLIAALARRVLELEQAKNPELPAKDRAAQMLHDHKPGMFHWCSVNEIRYLHPAEVLILMRRLYAEAVAAEREFCAKIAEQAWDMTYYTQVPHKIADAIRNRGKGLTP